MTYFSYSTRVTYYSKVVLIIATCMLAQSSPLDIRDVFTILTVPRSSPHQLLQSRHMPAVLVDKLLYAKLMIKRDMSAMALVW